jgi:Fe-Mn family superoxide dismutase
MHTLPELTYSFDALEPVIDARTMEIHHGKHHAAYVANLNNALQATKSGALVERDLTDLLANLDAVPEAQRRAVRNNGGGHFNHTLFWTILAQGKGDAPQGALAEAIAKDFGSFGAFKEKLSTAAATRFGSGWAWLSVTKSGLVVSSSPNQDSPIMDGSGTPILGLDVWEHAYYLNYQNRRPDYVKAFWSIVNWDEVSRRFQNASK